MLSAVVLESVDVVATDLAVYSCCVSDSSRRKSSLFLLYLMTTALPVGRYLAGHMTLF